MEAAGKLLEALAAILWPLLALVFIVRLLPTLKSLIESRSFKITVGAFEISAQEASNQIAAQIKDLQDKVVVLENSLAAPPGRDREAAIGPDEPVSAPASSISRLLWVDDKPENNAYEIARLQQDGWDIVQVDLTDAAIARFSSDGPFLAVISDMGRKEGGRYVSDAGLQFISRLREIDCKVPIFIYSSQNSARSRKTAVLAAGGTDITASPVELLRLIAALRRGKPAHS